MGTLNEPIAKRVAKLFRLLASGFDGEVLSAARRMRQQLAAEGLSFNDIATVIENANGEIEQLKYSDSDAEIIFARGVEKGRAEQSRKPLLAADFYDGASGAPRWNAMAMFCLERRERMRAHELQFVEDMAGRTLSYDPSEKQGKWLLAIFIKLGGMRQ
jgi:hypothetical protein